jgi:hypothetical protein
MKVYPSGIIGNGPSQRAINSTRDKPKQGIPGDSERRIMNRSPEMTFDHNSPSQILPRSAGPNNNRRDNILAENFVPEKARDDFERIVALGTQA